MIKKIRTTELAVTAILVGLIWTIQLVHYPTFNFIDEGSYKNFQMFHMNSITLLVAPLMILEMLFFILSMKFRFYEKKFQYLILFLLLSTIWLCTALVSVPLHNSLLNGKDEAIIAQLISTNWIRTLAWSIKLFLMVIWQKV
jgi:hypothetical protein